MKLNLLYAAVAALALLGGAGVAWWQQAEAAPQPAVKANDFWSARFTGLDGKPQSLAQFRGKPLVVNFWASWCAPCRQEMPDFVAVQRARGNKVQVLGIAIDNKAAVEKFLKEVPVNYPVLLGEQDAMDLMRANGNQFGGLPFTLVFDAQGKQVATHAGLLHRDKLEQYLNAIK
ncbi:TlpA family protein disulfide reductase [Chitinimonas lacunae]|uniref:TlpA family protein disulfide reductase n=1 Tax=Chitinimonas lacunae TaxID=1963018 RepID=A0ABV8MUZ2_9NEIS